MSITVHAQRLDAQHLIITESDLQSLITVARQVASVQFEERKDNLPIEGLMELAETSGAFDFLLDEREDIYTIDDLKVSSISYALSN